MTTELIAIEEDFLKQGYGTGAEVKFQRKSEDGTIYNVYAKKNPMYQWEQWGAPDEVLVDNKEEVQKWWRNQLH